MIKVLVVEDERSISDLIVMNLTSEGYTVATAFDGLEGLNTAENGNFDLIILDVMLPNLSGYDVCTKIREKNRDIPILFLSARGLPNERIYGLKLGADDYLPKPFDLEELLLRVSNLLKRKVANQTDSFSIGNTSIDFSTFEVKDSKGAVLKELSKKEAELLQLMIQHEGQVVSRDTIISSLWKDSNEASPRTIDNMILLFRKIFENKEGLTYFHTIRGVGYKFSRK